MARLLFIVEGQTEETFINELLAPHLYTHGYTQVSARLMGNARLRSRRGGVRGWQSVKKDILRHLRQDKEIFVTTMVDYYGLPHGRQAWPGTQDTTNLDVAAKAARIEAGMRADIEQSMPHPAYSTRLIPFVIVHEFEGLLFSDCDAFAQGIANPSLAAKFQEIRDAFESPEDINDSPETHPSKRVQRLMPQYEKPLYGNLAALEVGLAAIRNECPHFADWLQTLEKVPNNN